MVVGDRLREVLYCLLYGNRLLRFRWNEAFCWYRVVDSLEGNVFALVWSVVVPVWLDRVRFGTRRKGTRMIRWNGAMERW